jgi:hypothetical protein
MKEARVVLAAVAAASAAFVLAIGFERELVRLLSLDLGELEWVSDVVLSTALGVATFLWLHLRRARTELTRLERAQLVLDTELRIAAQIQRHLLTAPPRPATAGASRRASSRRAGWAATSTTSSTSAARSGAARRRVGQGHPGGARDGLVPHALPAARPRDAGARAARGAPRTRALAEHGGAPYLTASSAGSTSRSAASPG